MNYTGYVNDIIYNNNLGTKVLKVELIQELWSGYGKLLRVKTDEQSFIIKFITPSLKSENPKGWNSNFAHQRKLFSYQVEMNFYSNYFSHQTFSYTPKFIANFNSENIKYLVIEDLKESEYRPKREISEIEIERCILWLARFHYHYLNKKPKDLWEIGTYWHLETRLQEYESMPEGPLKIYAKEIDQKLNSSEYQTILHGDAKLANFLFSSSKVSAVDFQYCGKGVGVKDLAYFLSSIYDEDELFIYEKRSLDIYFNELKKLGLSDKIEKSWRELYPYSWCDFYRFLEGWSPGHYKINNYIKLQLNKVLDDIN